MSMSEKTRIVILGGGFGGVTTARRLERLCNHRPEVQDHGFALFHCKVVALVDCTIGHCFERNRCLALEGYLRGHTQKRSDGIEEPSTR